MNYFDYVNEVVKPQENKNLSVKMNFDIDRTAPAINPDKTLVIIRPFITKRDVLVSHRFDGFNYPDINVGIDKRGLCVDIGPIRIWDYSFWE